MKSVKMKLYSSRANINNNVALSDINAYEITTTRCSYNHNIDYNIMLTMMMIILLLLMLPQAIVRMTVTIKWFIALFVVW